MALPPLDPSNTARYVYTYNNGIDTHSIQLRVADTVIGTAASSFFNDVLTAAAPFLPLVTSVSFEYIAKGSNIALPRPLNAIAATYGTGTLATVQSPYALTFSGRSLGGRRCHLEFIGVKFNGDANYIYTAAELPAVGAVVNQLNAAGSDIACAIDGLEVNWYPRATSKQNDHVIRKRRST